MTTNPISIENEIEVWSKISEICYATLKKYKTSIESDE